MSALSMLFSGVSQRFGGKQSADASTERDAGSAATPDAQKTEIIETSGASMERKTEIVETPDASMERKTEIVETPDASMERSASVGTPGASVGYSASVGTPGGSVGYSASVGTPGASVGRGGSVGTSKRNGTSVKNEEPTFAPLSAADEEKIAKLRQISKLWQYRPIPPGPEASQPRRADAVRFGNVCAIGASVRGRKHIHGGTDCDDWFEIRAEREQGVLLIAVSDGAGSKKFSRIGAKASCRAAVESLRYLFQENAERLRPLRDAHGTELSPETLSLFRDIMSTAMEKAREAVYYAFESRIGKPNYESLQGFRDLSATLLLAAVIPSESGEHTVTACQVGDGAIALFDSDAPYERAMSLLGSPDSGDYAGETEFMTSPSLTRQEFEKRTVTRRLRFDSMFVMTDGVSDDYFPANPELFRLYCDLIANGVLPPKGPENNGKQVPIPAPLAFPDVGEEEQEEVPLNYAWLIRSATGLSLEELWNDNSPLARACRLLPETDGGEAGEGRLLHWLERYAEAASFDDRTLVVVRTGKGGGTDAQSV